LHGRDAAALFDALVAKADREPIAAPQCASNGCRPSVTGGDIRLSAEEALLTKEGIKAFGLPGWQDFAGLLAGLERGEGAPCQLHLSSDPGDGTLAGLAVMYADYPFRLSGYDELKRHAAVAQSLAPHTQGATEAW